MIRTSVAQLDAVAGLGADALVHGDRLDLDAVVAAIDAIGQRMRRALAIVDRAA